MSDRKKFVILMIVNVAFWYVVVIGSKLGGLIAF